MGSSSEKSTDSPVRIIGSRELHQNLPGILRELESKDVRYVLTVHGKPKAVLVGAQPYLELVQDTDDTSEALVGLQLSALLGVADSSPPLETIEKALNTQPKPKSDSNSNSNSNSKSHSKVNPRVKRNGKP